MVPEPTAHYTKLQCTELYKLHCSWPYWNLYYTGLYWNVQTRLYLNLVHSILHYTVLYYTNCSYYTAHCTVLYCTNCSDPHCILYRAPCTLHIAPWTLLIAMSSTEQDQTTVKYSSAEQCGSFEESRPLQQKPCYRLITAEPTTPSKGTIYTNIPST